MGQRSRVLMLVGLLVLSGLVVGCRKSAVPPVDELSPDEEMLAVIQEAQENTDQVEQMESPQATPTLEEEPEPVQTVELEPTLEATIEPTVEEILEPTPEPVVEAPEETTVAPTPAAVAGAATYTVQPGDNLFRIALRHNLTVQALAQANNITNPGLIRIGQVLSIPASQTPPTQPQTPSGCANVYVVQPGDNLFRIALRYNYSQYYLAQFNNIANPSLVYVGQPICIP